MTDFPVTDLNKVKRLAKRGHYDKDTIYSIIDETLICHVGFVQDGRPFVIPTIHARVGDEIFLHGSVANRMLQRAQEETPLCLTMTLIDGLVIARSVFHSSMNYRSVVLFGNGRLLETDEEKLRALEAITEHIARGRWNDARLPNKKELDATAVVAVTIETASAKIRTGPPNDDDEDYALPIWAGLVPMELRALAPVNDPKLGANISVPSYVEKYVRG